MWSLKLQDSVMEAQPASNRGDCAEGKARDALDQVDQAPDSRSSVRRVAESLEVGLEINLEVRRENDRLVARGYELLGGGEVGWVLDERGEVGGELEDGGIVEDVLLSGEEDLARDAKAEGGEVGVLREGELRVLEIVREGREDQFRREARRRAQGRRTDVGVNMRASVGSYGGIAHDVRRCPRWSNQTSERLTRVVPRVNTSDCLEQDSDIVDRLGHGPSGILSRTARGKGVVSSSDRESRADARLTRSERLQLD